MNPSLQEIVGKCSGKEPNSGGYLYRDGWLFFKNRYVVWEDSDLIPKILWEFHDSRLGGHAGVLKTFKRISKHFFWNKMEEMIKLYIKESLICQQMKSSNQRFAGLLTYSIYGRTFLWISLQSFQRLKVKL